MDTRSHKTQAHQNQSAAPVESQKQQRNAATFQFEDNRSETVTQRKLQETVSHSPQVKQAAQLQALMGHPPTPPAPVQKQENKTGMPHRLKVGIEQLSGYAMDDVRVHRNSHQPAQLQANAYAQGVQIHLGPGQEKHLPHEAWHVVQQKQGRVRPTLQLKGKVPVNDDKGLEREADVMGSKALQTAQLKGAPESDQYPSPTLLQAPRSIPHFHPSAHSSTAQLALNLNWYFGGAEKAHLNNLFAQVQASLAQMNALWINIRNRTPHPGAVGAQIGLLRNRFNAEDNTTVLWNDRAAKAATLTTLDADIHHLIETELNVRKAKLDGGTSAGNINAIQARAGAAFTRYAPSFPNGRFAVGIAHYGSVDDFADVLLAANASGASPHFLNLFLVASFARGWNNLGRARNFFVEMNGMAEAVRIQTLGWAHDFILVGNTGVGGGAMADHAGNGGANVALPGQTFPFVIRYWVAADRNAQVIIAQGNLDHWNCGHSFERYRLTMANANRAPVSSMWPRGVANAAKLAHAGAAIGALSAPIRQGIKADRNRIVLSNGQGGYDYTVGINNFDGVHIGYRLDQFFPVGGAGIPLPRAAMRSIIRIFGG